MSSRTERDVKGPDGTRLHLYEWAPTGERRAWLLIVHGYMDHAGRYDEVASFLASSGIAVTAYDQRGHGKSEGQRGYADVFGRYLDDLALVFSDLPTPRFLLGHSFGGLVSLDFVTSRGADLAGLVLSNPYLDTALAVPAWKVLAGRLLGKWAPRVSIPSGLESGMLSRDAEMVRRHAEDRLVFTQANARWYVEAMSAQTRVRALRQVPAPLLLLLGDADPVASVAASRTLYSSLECPDKTLREYPAALHEILNDLDRTTTYADIRDWILKRTP